MCLHTDQVSKRILTNSKKRGGRLVTGHETLCLSFDECTGKTSSQFILKKYLIQPFVHRDKTQTCMIPLNSSLSILL